MSRDDFGRGPSTHPPADPGTRARFRRPDGTLVRRIALLVAVGIAVYFVVLVTTVPARFVLDRVALPDGVDVGGVGGTVWRGRAAVVALPALSLRDLRWRLYPTALLRGRAAVQLEARLDRGFVEGHVELAPGHRLLVTDLQAAFRLEQVLAAAGYQGMAGDASLRLDRLRVAEGWPRELDGEFRVGDLVLTEWDDLLIGQYEVALSLDADDTIAGRIGDLGGPLEVAADLRVQPSLAWSLEGELRPRPEADPGLRDAVSLLGPADPAGRHAFGVDGRL